MAIVWLQCVCCHEIREWDRVDEPEGPGVCSCTPRVAAPWRVVRKPTRGPGHVIVMGDKGWQELHWPSFREGPNWRPYPVRRA